MKNLISKDDALEKIDLGQKEVILIDARPQDIYTEVSDQIEGAKHLSEEHLKKLYSSISKDKEYLVYMSEGEDDLAEKFADFMRSKGFDAYAIEGGFEQWRDAGFPIEPINAKGTPFLE